MADQHSVDPFAEFETLLRAELAVEPSREFLPRVRERIRTEPGPSRWFALWRFAPLAAATLLALAIGFWLWPTQSPSFEPRRASVQPPVLPAAPPPATSVDPAFTAANRRPVDARPSLRARIRERFQPIARPTSTTEVEGHDTSHLVVIDARQREALLSFIAMARRGQVSAETFATTTPPPAAIADQVKTIAVEDVAVSPIAPGGVLLMEVERK